jgi:hypothetical protein
MSLVLSAKVTADRIERAIRIYESNLVRSLGRDTFIVRSESSDAYYIVNSLGCTCPDSVERKMICKHIWACFVGAILTIWRIHLATTQSEVEALSACDHSKAPEGIKRTIKLECQKAIERLSA